MNEWHENLKEILMNAGAKNLPTVFLFSDTQIVTETFLEDINNILNSGEVPNLFESDELEKIIGMILFLFETILCLQLSFCILILVRQSRCPSYIRN